MLTNSPEVNSVGGYGGLGIGGGFGGGGILEGIILASLLGRGRGGLFGGDSGDGGCAAEAVILNAITGSERTTVGEGRALNAAICDSEKTNLQQFYAGAIQTSNSTQAIKDQATGFFIANDNRFDALATQGTAQTAAILARINQTEIDQLRDELHETRRGRDRDGIAISIQNSNSQPQAQVQAQFQAQNEFLVRRFNEFDNQINNTKQGIVNLGTMVASGTQSTAATNIK